MDEQKDYVGLWYPGIWQARKKLNEHSRFVHYLPAEAAISVIKNEQIWMRSVACQNDFREVEHGLDFFEREFSANKDRLIQIFGHRIIDVTALTFQKLLPEMRIKTFIWCVSQQGDNESTLGRLSMWRAYGQNSGVAIVLKPEAFMRESGVPSFFSIPVNYKELEDFKSLFADAVRVWSENKELLVYKYTELEQAKGLFTCFRTLVLCTKHLGFEEEKEWRVIFSPSDGAPDYIKKSVESIRGVPQVIYKICLRKFFKMKTGCLNELIDRVIIGPTQYPIQIRDALVHELELKRFRNASEKVIISDIPLR